MRLSGISQKASQLRRVPETREALIKSARAGSERFCSRARYGKRGNTVCISRFSYRRPGAKDPLSSRRRFIQSFPRFVKGLAASATCLCYCTKRPCPSGIAAFPFNTGMLFAGCTQSFFASERNRVAVVHGMNLSHHINSQRNTQNQSGQGI